MRTDRRARAAWMGVLGAAVGHLSVDGCMGIWPLYKVLAHLDLRLAGSIATAATLAGNGLQLLFGPLADRGHRRLLVALGVLAAGAVCFLPYAHTAGPLLGLMILASAGSAAFHPAAAGHAGAARTGRPGLAVALYMAGGYVGFALSQLAYAGALRALGGRLAPLAALPLLLSVALLVLGRGRGPGPQPGAAAAAAIARAQAAAGPAPQVAWGKLAALFAIQALSACVGTAVQFLTPEIFGGPGSALAMGGAHCLGTLAGGAALFPAGAARDRWGAGPVLLVANVGAGLSLGLLALAGARQGPALALLLVFNFANAANTVVALAEGTQGLDRAGSSVSALLMGLPWLAAAPAPALAGWLAAPLRGGSAGAALAWMGLCSPAAAAVALLLPAASRRWPSAEQARPVTPRR